MIKVENNIVTVNGLSIQFDSESKANSFLLDYISKHGQVATIEKKTSSREFHLLVENYGYVEIENLDLSVRSFNCLKRAGINYIEDILKLDYNDITRVRNLGRNSMLEIERVVNEFIRSSYITWSNDSVYVL